jgi:hypothetical protein
MTDTVLYLQLSNGYSRFSDDRLLSLHPRHLLIVLVTSILSFPSNPLVARQQGMGWGGGRFLGL